MFRISYFFSNSFQWVSLKPQTLLTVSAPFPCETKLLGGWIERNAPPPPAPAPAVVRPDCLFPHPHWMYFVITLPLASQRLEDIFLRSSPREPVGVPIEKTHKHEVLLRLQAPEIPYSHSRLCSASHSSLWLPLMYSYQFKPPAASVPGRQILVVASL